MKPEDNVRVKLSLCLTKHNTMNTYILIKHHDIKTYGGSAGIAPRILNLGTRCG